MRRISSSIPLILLLTGLIVFLPVSSAAGPFQQANSPEARAQALMEQLTPEEKVGQLFLVTFDGTDVSEESQIYDMVVNRHVGGVVLLAENGNLNGQDNPLNEAWMMIRQLQTIDLLGSQTQRLDPITGEPFSPTFIPLFIGISQEGDGYPADQILEGFTPMPNNMAIGATWNPQLSKQAGVVLGTELIALGINILLGPSLDVLDPANLGSLGDPGTRSYGADPFWVSEMGRSFVSGLKLGSQDELLVIGKHLPGIGGADRPVENEVPTIRKSLLELIQIELAPFFAVTSSELAGENTLDGMLLTHIQYQGFGGNIYATSRPASFDPGVLSDLLLLEQFSSWREEGGLIVSDKLGVESIRKFFDPTEQTFNARIIARDALLAGNDLLYLYNFRDNDDPDSYTSIIRTLDFFSQKYRDDPPFAQRVDESVLRILTKKFSLYENFNLDNVLSGEEELEVIGNGNQVTFSVAQEAVTLLWPSLESLVLSSPGTSEEIVFITDSYSVSPCDDCPMVENIGVSDLSFAVDELYGLEGAGLTSRNNLHSYSFMDLLTALDEENGTPLLQSRIRSATWVVFGMVKPDENRPESLALQRLLSERPDWLQGKNVIVFAFNAPYYLDATEISKLTAYYALYSKQEPFVEVAARILFAELVPSSSPPVSVAGISYDLSFAISADPDQQIGLRAYEVFQGNLEETPEPPDIIDPQSLDLEIGDMVRVETSRILDRNGNQVPDNSPVILVIHTTRDEQIQERVLLAPTIRGVAKFDLTIEDGGPTDLQAIMTNAEFELRSAFIHFDVQQPVPTVGPTITVTPDLPQINQTITPGVLVTLSPPDLIDEERLDVTNIMDWVVGLLISFGAGFFVYQIGILTNRLRWRVRWAITTILGGLFITTYFAFMLPGSETLVSLTGTTGVILLTIIGTLLGWLVGWIWGQVNNLL